MHRRSARRTRSCRRSSTCVDACARRACRQHPRRTKPTSERPTMDRMIYLAMSGAKALMQRQDALSHNLANAETNGFRADLMAYRAVPARQEGTATTRVWALESSAGFDAQSGPLRQTGNALDVAVRGDGWIAVQAADGD